MLVNSKHCIQEVQKETLIRIPTEHKENFLSKGKNNTLKKTFPKFRRPFFYVQEEHWLVDKKIICENFVKNIVNP